MSADLFIRIAITHPSHYPDETNRIVELLKNNEVDFVHIRKPGWCEDEVSVLIKEIPEKLHPRIKIHDHFNLIRTFDLGGVHLNSRNPYAPEGIIRISKSLHSLDELDQLEASDRKSDYKDNLFSSLTEQHQAIRHYDYVTLSPIFDSISKTGYHSQFSLEEIKHRIMGKRVVALGGVTPSKFKILKDTGFYGAALLGYFFP